MASHMEIIDLISKPAYCPPPAPDLSIMVRISPTKTKKHDQNTGVVGWVLIYDQRNVRQMGGRMLVRTCYRVYKGRAVHSAGEIQIWNLPNPGRDRGRADGEIFTSREVI